MQYVHDTWDTPNLALVYFTGNSIQFDGVDPQDTQYLHTTVIQTQPRYVDMVIVPIPYTNTQLLRIQASSIRCLLHKNYPRLNAIEFYGKLDDKYHQRFVQHPDFAAIEQKMTRVRKKICYDTMKSCEDFFVSLYQDGDRANTPNENASIKGEDRTIQCEHDEDDTSTSDSDQTNEDQSDDGSDNDPDDGDAVCSYQTIHPQCFFLVMLLFILDHHCIQQKTIDIHFTDTTFKEIWTDAHEQGMTKWFHVLWRICCDKELLNVDVVLKDQTGTLLNKI